MTTDLPLPGVTVREEGWLCWTSSGLAPGESNRDALAVHR